MIKHEKKLLIIHPGLAKSGTTTIQEHFNNFKNTKNLYHDKQLSKFNSITYKLFCLSSNKINNKKNLNNFLDLVYKKTKQKKNYIYSFEGIFNNIRFDEKRNLNNFFYIVNKLKIKFRIKILLTVRNQIDIINSLYISHYGLLYKKYPSADEYVKRVILRNKRIDLFNYMFVKKFIYKKTKIQPEFILFEDLKFNKKKYIHELSQIIENKKETKLNFRNFNKTKTSNDKFVIFSGDIFYIISRINTYLKKKIPFFEILTTRFVSILKNFIPKKLITKSSIESNYLILKKYNKTNKDFFKTTKNDFKQKKYKKYFITN